MSCSIGARLPERLRSFYRSWGRRKAITESRAYLILPEARLVFPDTGVIAIESQGASYWSILSESLADPNPPVYFGDVNWSAGDDTPNVDAWRPSHEHVSDFLDGFVLARTFAKSAPHGAYAQPYTYGDRDLRHEGATSAKYPERASDLCTGASCLTIWSTDGLSSSAPASSLTVRGAYG
jgi:hypothetical protein